MSDSRRGGIGDWRRQRPDNEHRTNYQNRGQDSDQQRGGHSSNYNEYRSRHRYDDSGDSTSNKYGLDLGQLATPMSATTQDSSRDFSSMNPINVTERLPTTNRYQSMAITPVPMSSTSTTSTTFKCVRRPGHGTIDSSNRIPLIANYFQITVPNIKIYEYDIEIIPGLKIDPNVPQRGGYRGGRGGGHGNFPRDFRPFSGKMKKQILNDYNRQVLEQLRTWNKGTHRIHGHQLFHDPDEKTTVDSNGKIIRKGIEYVYDGFKNFYTTRPLNGLTEHGFPTTTKEHRQPPFNLSSASPSVDVPSPRVQFLTTIKFAKIVDLNTINEFIAGQLDEQPLDAFKAVDIIMRHGPTVDHVVLGHGIFRKNVTNHDPDPSASDVMKFNLTQSKTLLFGHYQAMKTCAIGPALNIDRNAAVFVNSGPLINFMAAEQGLSVGTLIERIAQDVHTSGSNKFQKIDTFNTRRPKYSSETVVDELIVKFKGVKVSTTYGKYRKTFKINRITQIPASLIPLGDANVDATGKRSYDAYSGGGGKNVASYFNEKYGISGDDLKRLEALPCAQIGSDRKPAFIPLTMLHIDANQNVSRLKPTETVDFIKHCSSQSTRSRFDVIKESANHVAHCDHAKKTLSKFNLSMIPEPVKLDAFVLDHPTLLYGGDANSDATTGAEQNAEQFKPKDGRWSLSKDHKLLKTNVIDLWLLINFVPGLETEKIDHFVRRLKDVGRQIGVNVEEPEKVEYHLEYQRNDTFKRLKSYLQTCSHAFACIKPNLILFIFDKKDDAIYQDIKYNCDIKYGIINQCVSDNVIDICWKSKSDIISETLTEISSDFAPISNILMKINTKFDGINSLIAEDNLHPILSNKCMIIGADVTHPDFNNDKVSASIAAITSTYDDNHVFYYPCIRGQYGYSEIIHDVYDMFKEIGRHYFMKNQYLPLNIIFYRDGVSDNMFPEIYEKEILKMKEAFNYLNTLYRLNQEVKVIYIVVQKRHHARFMVDANSDAETGAKEKYGKVDTDISSEKDDLMEFEVDELIEKTKDCQVDAKLEGDLKETLMETGTNKGYLDHKYGKGGNIFGGVTIDTKIVHPYEYDFFLCSHDCVNGTPRPGHYYVLLDEIKLEPNDLYQITFNLCHTYAPATRALSIPVPVQYAHLAAKRSRAHLIASQAEQLAGLRIWQKLDPRELIDKSDRITQTINVPLPIKERMYFI